MQLHLSTTGRNICTAWLCRGTEHSSCRLDFCPAPHCRCWNMSFLASYLGCCCQHCSRCLWMAMGQMAVSTAEALLLSHWRCWHDWHHWGFILHTESSSGVLVFMESSFFTLWRDSTWSLSSKFLACGAGVYRTSRCFLAADGSCKLKQQL